MQGENVRAGINGGSSTVVILWVGGVHNKLASDRYINRSTDRAPSLIEGFEVVKISSSSTATKSSGRVDTCSIII